MAMKNEYKFFVAALIICNIAAVGGFLMGRDSIKGVSDVGCEDKTDDETGEYIFNVNVSAPSEALITMPAEPNESDTANARRLGNLLINYVDYTEGVIDVNEYVRRGESEEGKWEWVELEEAAEWKLINGNKVHTVDN